MPLQFDSLARCGALLTAGILATSAIALCAVVPALAQDAPPPGEIDKSKYSPYPEETFPNRVYFGDTHLHTSYSADAGMIGNTLGPEEAYRFARGEAVTSSTGLPARAQAAARFPCRVRSRREPRPCAAIAEANPELLKTEFGQDRFTTSSRPVTRRAPTRPGSRGMNALDDPLKGNEALTRSLWSRITEAAEKYNEPGRFTAFIGFEWTSMPDGNNLHRNVIFRDEQGQGRPDHPDLAISTATTREAVEVDGGLREEDRRPAAGHPAQRQPLQRPDVRRRHADDQEADRPRLCRAPHALGAALRGHADKGRRRGAPARSRRPTSSPTSRPGTRAASGASGRRPRCCPANMPARPSSAACAYEAELGANPFKFGMVGSTDSHTASPRPRRTTSSARWCCSSRPPTRSASKRSSPDDYRRRRGN